MAALPPGWTDADIGAPADAGSATYTNGGWIISGGGGDIWRTNDQFNFASRTCDCDGAVVALVTSVQNTDPSRLVQSRRACFATTTPPGRSTHI